MLDGMTPKLSVLMVDDDPTELLLAQEAFETHAQTVNLDTCSSGTEAIAHLQNPANTLPDVIITDLNMPGLTGLEVARRLAALAAPPPRSAPRRSLNILAVDDALL